MWSDKIKELGINLHVVATGAGAGVQKELWEVPGCSTFLSGCSFPYDAAEQEEFLGFMPEHFSSEENAIDLASAAYMKAYKFGGKKPVGLGVAASVASTSLHRGDHRIHACVITEDKVLTFNKILEKGTGIPARVHDGMIADDLAFFMLVDALGISNFDPPVRQYNDATEKAKERFFARPFFSATGKRFANIPESKHWALMPGAYNPPHEGHFGTANNVSEDYHRNVIFEVTAQPPHKDALSVQALLQRAKVLQGHNRIFTKKNPLYLDKARAYPGIPLVMGADAMVRLLDPKWGVDILASFKEFKELKTELYIAGRTMGSKFVTWQDIKEMLTPEQSQLFVEIARPISGHWDISSTEIRNKMA
jgi:nicotinic acid mononucleotide adenylyltransferase